MTPPTDKQISMIVHLIRSEFRELCIDRVVGVRDKLGNLTHTNMVCVDHERWVRRYLTKDAAAVLINLILRSQNQDDALTLMRMLQCPLKK